MPGQIYFEVFGLECLKKHTNQKHRKNFNWKFQEKHEFF